ncbi:MAG: ABC transporter ATP-binding protein [Anaerolineae bacterium]|nr:ABC transporter ATP-binding protein/permease [Anaerolineae bacterium]MDW8097858.1 ABC transporter ATP-binding protein [Anaerolineae bacterium]
MHVLKRLASYLGPYWPRLIVTSALILLYTGLNLLPPLFQRAIVDQVIGQRDLSRLAGWIVGLIGVYALAELVNFGDQYLRHILGERFILDLRVRLYDHLQRLSLGFFERTSTGELMSRVSNDVNALEQFITHGVILTAVDFLRLVGASVVLLALDWRLALVVLATVPAIAIGLRRFNQRSRPIYRRVRDRLGDINARLQDDLAGIRVVQAFGQEDAELERFRRVSEGYYHERVRAIRTWSTFFPALDFVSALSGAAMLGVGAAMVVAGQMSLGTLVAFLSYVQSFYDPIRRLTEVDNTFQQAIAAGERIFELMDEVPGIQDAPDAVELENVRGEVVFEDVHFHYGDGNEVLHDIDFRIAPGEVVALVGPSGAGKTSIANLLCRFYDPAHGRILIDGHDLRKIRLRSLRRHIAVVLQDTFLFNGTVRENLIYGKPDATEEEMIAAAKTAYAHEFIMSLPNGYDTEIGERGMKLSGGQRQRLALARAILTNPRILILDEATSSVDAEAEYLIQQALEETLKGRTALVIAHRLSTIRNADKIIALENGRIREIGHHRELLSRCGLYSQLYQRQLELATADDGR